MEYTTVYHGTISNNYANIMHQGLCPIYDDYSYVTTDYKRAMYYAWCWTGGVNYKYINNSDVVIDDKGLIITIKLPTKMLVKDNYNVSEIDQYKVYGGIDKKYIIDADIVDVIQDDITQEEFEKICLQAHCKLLGIIDWR